MDTFSNLTPEYYLLPSLSIAGRACSPLLHEEFSCHNMHERFTGLLKAYRSDFDLH
jgi:hypothetical protein